MLSYNVWELKSTNYMKLEQTTGHLLRVFPLAVPMLNASHILSHRMFNTALG